MSELTPSQSKALKFINSKIKVGCSPTLREICGFMNFKSIGSVQDVISALRKKGYIETPQKQAARSLSLTSKAKNFFTPVEEFFFEIPCLGSVPAGHPAEAFEERVDTMRLSPTLLPHPRPPEDSLFAVRTVGESMMGAGILNGDWLIVRYGHEAESGSIVIARVDGEATCKRLIQDKENGWYLKAENPEFDNIYSDRLEVVGSVVALQRSVG